MRSDVRRYRIWDLTLASAVPLPELPASAAPAADWTFTVERRPPPRPGRRWFHYWRLPDGRRALDFARHREGYQLRFDDADFDVLPDRRALRCYRRTAAPRRTLRHLLLDQVLPLVSGGPRRLPLHASANALPGGIVAFLGGAGQGKSTLAAALARAGYPTVADDCLLVDAAGRRPTALSSYPGLRLQADSLRFAWRGAGGAAVSHRSRKRRVAGRTVPFAGGRAPLRRLYLLDRDAGAARVRIARRPARQTMIDLLSFVFHLDVRDPGRVRAAFEQAAALLERVEVRRLTYPHDYGRLDEVAAAIVRDATSG